jgi:MHS family proline/betaine transporter-like MFS transporter
MVVLLLLIPVVGKLSDHIGRKPVLLTAIGGMFILAWPLFWMLHYRDLAVNLIGQVGLAVLSALF